MIVLFTDFGWNGPYVGQMKAQLLSYAPTIPLVDLLHDVPAFDFYRAAYLLASYSDVFPVGTVFLAVVDPGVGSVLREPVIVEADGRWFVGPGNGLFERVAAQANHSRQWRITWKPEKLSLTFHGRDLFAPVAAMLAAGQSVASLAQPSNRQPLAWPVDLAEVIYIDPLCNAVTGLRAAAHHHVQEMRVGELFMQRYATFADVAPGTPIFYANANGMLEIAVNQGRADHLLGLLVGTPLRPL